MHLNNLYCNKHLHIYLNARCISFLEWILESQFIIDHIMSELSRGTENPIRQFLKFRLVVCEAGGSKYKIDCYNCGLPLLPDVTIEYKVTRQGEGGPGSHCYLIHCCLQPCPMFCRWTDSPSDRGIVGAQEENSRANKS